MLWQGRQSNGDTFTTPTTHAPWGGEAAVVRGLGPPVPGHPAESVPSPLMKASPVPCTERSLNCASLDQIKVVSLWHSVQVRSEADGARPGSPGAPGAPAGPPRPTH